MKLNPKYPDNNYQPEIKDQFHFDRNLSMMSAHIGLANWNFSSTPNQRSTDYRFVQHQLGHTRKVRSRFITRTFKKLFARLAQFSKFVVGKITGVKPQAEQSPVQGIIVNKKTINEKTGNATVVDLTRENSVQANDGPHIDEAA